MSSFAVAAFLQLCPLQPGVFAASPLTPGQALASFRLEPGLRVELVAAEPIVASPCAVAFDEKGRMFVAENRGYPTGSADGKPVGVIAILEDLDHDGRFEKRTVFADGLTFPNGVLPWRGGVVVTCAPDVLWLADTNADGRADVREVWLTGFDDRNTTQLRVSHPTLGLDGWIYLTSGWTGPSKVHSPKFPEHPIVETRTDSRFNPFTGEFQAVDGRAQFGQSFDDFGRRFICYNRVQVQHVVGSSRHWKRNPDFAFAETVQNCPEEMVNDLLGNTENRAARIYPISQNVTTADSHAGTFTAACGVHVYRGAALPGYYGRVFTCDPTGNLVHWDDLAPNGPTFTARRSTNRMEFLASTDNWFRPVNLAAGPEGALYICDMYRRIIEHPQYLPEEVRKRTDFDSGKTMGRIWRVASGASPRSKIQIPQFKSSEALLALDHPNSWNRDTAFRLLLERWSTDASASMPGVVKSLATRGATERHRATAFQLLDALGQLDYPTLAQVLCDQSPRLRELAALRAGDFARRFYKAPEVLAELAERLKVLSGDTDARVRFAATLALGEINARPEVMPCLAQVAWRDGSNRWMRAALLSGIRERAVNLLEAIVRSTAPLPGPEFMIELGRLIGTAERARFKSTLHLLMQRAQPAEEPAQIAGIAGLLEGIRAHSEVSATLASSFDAPGGQLSLVTFDGVLERAEQWLADTQAPLAVREAAASLLASADPHRARRRLPLLLGAAEREALQQTAVQGLLRLPDIDAGATLLKAEQWPRLTAAVRQNVLATMVSQPRYRNLLFDAFESGALPVSSVPAVLRNQLIKHKDRSIGERAEKIFKSAGGDRMKAYETAKSSLTLKGSAAAGRELFATHCASCHRLDRVGVAVGPDLLSARNQSKETILLHVLVPNYEILPGFAAYQIETTDGRELTGLIASETPSTLTLRQAQGIEETLPRTRIRSLVASVLSLMPDGFEDVMKPQELADLLAYLKGEGG